MTTVTTIDGAPVGVGTAAAFDALSADFHAVTGLSLRLNGALAGIRTYAQQAALYQAYLKGGTLAANPAAPEAAHHMSGHALDISDTGTDAGVDTIGSARHTILLGLLAKHGFTNEGDSFSEPEGWHYYYTGDPYTAPSGNVNTTTTPLTTLEKELNGMFMRDEKGNIYFVNFANGQAKHLTGPQWTVATQGGATYRATTQAAITAGFKVV